MNRYPKIFYLSCLVFLILIDQTAKYLIRSRGGFYICNINIAFGIQLPEFIFWIIWITIILFILTAIYKNYFIHSTLYLTLILAGALGNIIDRIIYGCVIDFIDLKIWPVFNLADSYITLGVIFFLITANSRNKFRNS